MMADDLPFRADASAMRGDRPGPEGALLPFKERGQTAEGGPSMEAGVGPTDATGHGNTLPARLKG
jgi:hypothetical protein